MFRIISLVVAVAALGAACYVALSLHSQQGKLYEIEAAINSLEAAIADLPRAPARDESQDEILDRLVALESQVDALGRGAQPEAGPPPEAAPDPQAIRRVVREVQEEDAKQRNEERLAVMEEWHEKAQEMAQKHQRKQEDRFDSWLAKFSESAGLTIAQEEGIREAYEWSREEIGRRTKEKMKDGGPFMFGPEMFGEIAAERMEKIKDVLTPAQFEQFEEYRRKNPLPEMAFSHSFSPDGGAEADVMILQPEIVPEVDEKEDRGK